MQAARLTNNRSCDIIPIITIYLVCIAMLCTRSDYGKIALFQMKNEGSITGNLQKPCRYQTAENISAPILFQKVLKKAGHRLRRIQFYL